MYNPPNNPLGFLVRISLLAFLFLIIIMDIIFHTNLITANMMKFPLGGVTFHNKSVRVYDFILEVCLMHMQTLTKRMKTRRDNRIRNLSELVYMQA